MGTYSSWIRKALSILEVYILIGMYSNKQFLSVTFGKFAFNLTSSIKRFYNYLLRVVWLFSITFHYHIGNLWQRQLRVHKRYYKKLIKRLFYKILCFTGNSKKNIFLSMTIIILQNLILWKTLNIWYNKVS